ncbi:MAG TPA: thiamine diphosphokinase [Lachnospiraceae bacterium]|nr:thiamine diphosphokinase [Lachnospiraceae bacterium]
MTEMNHKVLIITGGSIDEAFLKNCVENNKYTEIIAVDHGLMAADRLNLPLNHIVGDFDSVSEHILQKYKDSIVPIKTFPMEKDKTDTQIAIEMALSHKAASIHLIGATGSRLDHTLANLHLLLLPLEKQVPACILDTNNKIYLKRESFTLQRKKQHGTYVSFLPFHSDVYGLTLEGFKYPLDRIHLAAGESLCISNEIVEEEAIVSFTKGILAVFETKD